MSRNRIPTKASYVFLLVCLAASHSAAAAAPEAAAPAAAAKGRDEADPILRLDLPGHTGEVRALAFTPDSRRLISGGRDKVAMVWTLEDAAIPDAEGGDGERVTRNIARRRARERTLRWQVARGTRGAIQAIAVSTPVNGEAGGEQGSVAMAGSGAMGSTGEILVLKAADGSLQATLGGGDRIGHRQSVTALDFTTDGRWLLSQDLDGQAFAWDRANAWTPVELAAREDQRLGKEGAAALRAMPPLRPAVAIGAGRAVLPTLVSPATAAKPIWQLELVELNDPRQRKRLPEPHLGVVTALAASADGTCLASGDLSGLVRVWRLPDGGTKPVEIEIRPLAESLSLSPDGKRLAVSVASDGRGAAPRVEIWSVEPLRKIASRTMPQPVRAVRFSPDGKTLAWTGGRAHEISIADVDAAAADAKPEADPLAAANSLGGVGRPITQVAFGTTAADAEAGSPPRRLAISTQQNGPDGKPAPLEAAFDLETLANADVGKENNWLTAAGNAGGWSIEPKPNYAKQGFEVWQLLKGGAPAGRVELVLDWQGRAGARGRAFSWIHRTGEKTPWAVAIGADRGIFLYKLVDEGACPLVRRFRGHEDGVLALAVSEDSRWLASGGGDGLAMLWSLAGLERERPIEDRWGVSVSAKDGRAVVDAVEGAGPLAGRDVRAGDVITEISWTESAGAVTSHKDAAAIVAALPAVPWNAQVAFSTRRLDKDQKVFQRLPAWENIASLHLAANREWAYWTPRGYYAASANGDTLFGWLVNRGLDELPRFFKAQQFRRRLERPDVMSRLLVAGSLDAALRDSGRELPESSAIVLPQQIAMTPEVRILDPRPGASADGKSIVVTAEVDTPDGTTLSRITAYASGVVAPGKPRVVEERPAADGRPRRTVYAWDLPLPKEQHHLVQVFAAAAEGPTELREVPIEAPPVAQKQPRTPRLYLLASGVNRYANSNRFAELGLTNLTFAVGDARSIRESLSRRSLGLYDLTADAILVNQEVTRAGWKRAIEELAEKVGDEIVPDDLLVVFLAGHGMNDSGKYSYLCHDAELTVTAGRDPQASPAGSITWDDFDVLQRIPCRKLAIVDTCHSGALGPAARSTTVREFQENMILVLAAASDEEPSQESGAWGHGAFTKTLLEALDGAADVGRTAESAAKDAERPDGVVSLDEVVDYVLRKVPEMTLVDDDESTAQHPTVSPDSIVPYITLPVAAMAKPDK
jgi:WD40 repeat protein